ncbi:MAG: serine hydrolase [Gemmatimonadetes bacterium]|nr:serine hydrolase [Gemmatimonadota bacterium]
MLIAFMPGRPRPPVSALFRPKQGARFALAPLALAAVLVAASAFGWSCATAGGTMRPVRPGPDSRLSAAAWVDSVASALPPRQRIAQLIMVWMTGGYAPADHEEQTRIATLVREPGIGGVVVSLGTPLGYADRIARLQAEAEVPLLMTADFESGVGFRVSNVYRLPHMVDMGSGTSFPPNMAFGAAGSEELVRRAASVTAAEARALGIHMTFSPVLDVNNNPENPIINTRSFGEDPGEVARLGGAYIRGIWEGGALATAKHFPGHGDTDTDSHLSLPSIPGDRRRLDAMELVPFRAAVDMGVDAVMTAHVAAPGLLGPGAPPATLAPEIMTDMLRGDMGFEGALFTDALDMGAIVDGYGAGEAAVLALEAGADVLLMPDDPEEAIEAVLEAVASGRLTEARIDESLRRVLELKARAGLHRGDGVPSLQGVAGSVGIAAHRALAADVARRSITLVRDQDGVVPLTAQRGLRVLSVTLAGTNDLAAGRTFDAGLRSRLPRSSVSSARVDPGTPTATYDSLLRRASAHDLTILSVYLQPSGGEDAPELPDDAAAFGAAVAGQGGGLAVISFGNPYLLTSLPEAGTYMLAWSGIGVSQTAAADALAGWSEITGALPVSLPPFHEIGEGLYRPGPPTPPEVPPEDQIPTLERPFGEPDPPDGTGGWGAGEAPPSAAGMDARALARVDGIIEAAVASGASPGAALAVGRRGRTVRLRGYGNLDWGEASGPADETTLYDLASLTKVVGTTTAIMLLVDDGLITLDTRIARYLPEWGDDWKNRITVRDLLLHRGGLPPFRPFWRDLGGRAEYRAAIDTLPPPGGRAIGDSTVYSDIGFIALGLLAESATAQPLDQLLRNRVFGPLGMSDTKFSPVGQTPPGQSQLAEPLLRRIAPTEVDTLFRGRHVHGEVHDENAFALGGVSGHAGLFSTARDLGRFAAWMLDASRRGAGSGGTRSRAERVRGDPVRPATVAEFTRRWDETASRALGWDTPSGRSSSGRYFGAGGRAFGHTGFTGTSIWIDPDLDVYVVLLTNRVNPTRENTGHVPLRRAVHDAVAEAIRDMPVPVRGEQPSEPPLQRHLEHLIR